MRPGPGLVVMALAFISGARRGSTSININRTAALSLTSLPASTSTSPIAPSVPGPSLTATLTSTLTTTTSIQPSLPAATLSATVALKHSEGNDTSPPPPAPLASSPTKWWSITETTVPPTSHSFTSDGWLRNESIDPPSTSTANIQHDYKLPLDLEHYRYRYHHRYQYQHLQRRGKVTYKSVGDRDGFSRLVRSANDQDTIDGSARTLYEKEEVEGDTTNKNKNHRDKHKIIREQKQEEEEDKYGNELEELPRENNGLRVHYTTHSINMPRSNIVALVHNITQTTVAVSEAALDQLIASPEGDVNISDTDKKETDNNSNNDDDDDEGSILDLEYPIDEDSYRLYLPSSNGKSIISEIEYQEPGEYEALMVSNENGVQYQLNEDQSNEFAVIGPNVRLHQLQVKERKQIAEFPAAASTKAYTSYVPEESGESVVVNTNRNTEEYITKSYRSIILSKHPISRLNPWISACDLAQPGSMQAPDLQGECSAGTLPMAWVDEGPGPPACPRSYKLSTKHITTTITTADYDEGVVEELHAEENNYYDHLRDEQSAPHYWERNLNMKLRNSAVTNKWMTYKRESESKFHQNQQNSQNEQAFLLNYYSNFRNVNTTNTIKNTNRDNDRMDHKQSIIMEDHSADSKYSTTENGRGGVDFTTVVTVISRNSSSNQHSPITTAEDTIVQPQLPGDGSSDIPPPEQQQPGDDDALQSAYNYWRHFSNTSDSISNLNRSHRNRFTITSLDGILWTVERKHISEVKGSTNSTTTAIEEGSFNGSHPNRTAPKSHNKNTRSYNAEGLPPTPPQGNVYHQQQKHRNLIEEMISNNHNNIANTEIDENEREKNIELKFRYQRDKNANHATKVKTMTALMNQEDPNVKTSTTKFEDPLPEKDNQCLDYLGDSEKTKPKHLCQLRAAGELLLQLRQLRLRNCCERNVYSALHTYALNATLSGGESCERTLKDLIELDAMTARITCSLSDILFRFDCRQVYSIIHQCNDCKEAYRRWVCSTLIPYFAEPNDVLNGSKTLSVRKDDAKEDKDDGNVQKTDKVKKVVNYETNVETENNNRQERQRRFSPEFGMDNNESLKYFRKEEPSLELKTTYNVLANSPRQRHVIQEHTRRYHQMKTETNQLHYNVVNPMDKIESDLDNAIQSTQSLKRIIRTNQMVFKKRRRIRPCLSICQTVEQKCPYLLPADRAPALPTQYAGEPTFLCLDRNIPETGKQIEKSSYGPPDCCYTYCGQVSDGLCTYCSNFTTNTTNIIATHQMYQNNDEKFISDPASMSTNGANDVVDDDLRHRKRVYNITLQAVKRPMTLNQTGDSIQMRIQAQISKNANKTVDLRMASISISVRKNSTETMTSPLILGPRKVPQIIERLPYYAYCDGVLYYDDDAFDMPHEAASGHCHALAQVQSRCSIPYYASDPITTVTSSSASRFRGIQDWRRCYLLWWIFSLFCLCLCTTTSAKIIVCNHHPEGSTNSSKSNNNFGHHSDDNIRECCHYSRASDNNNNDVGSFICNYHYLYELNNTKKQQQKQQMDNAKGGKDRVQMPRKYTTKDTYYESKSLGDILLMIQHYSMDLGRNITDIAEKQLSVCVGNEVIAPVKRISGWSFSHLSVLLKVLAENFVFMNIFSTEFRTFNNSYIVINRRVVDYTNFQGNFKYRTKANDNTGRRYTTHHNHNNNKYYCCPNINNKKINTNQYKTNNNYNQSKFNRINNLHLKKQQYTQSQQQADVRRRQQHMTNYSVLLYVLTVGERAGEIFLIVINYIVVQPISLVEIWRILKFMQDAKRQQDLEQQNL